MYLPTEHLGQTLFKATNMSRLKTTVKFLSKVTAKEEELHR